jgi:hypothetical protein
MYFHQYRLPGVAFSSLTAFLHRENSRSHANSALLPNDEELEVAERAQRRVERDRHRRQNGQPMPRTSEIAAMYATTLPIAVHAKRKSRYRARDVAFASLKRVSQTHEQSAKPENTRHADAKAHQSNKAPKAYQCIAAK